MNVLISVNKFYLDKAEVMLCSLAENNDCKIQVFMINNNLKEKEIDVFKNRLKKNAIQLRIIKIQGDEFEGMPVKQYSIEMYNRILAQYLLPKEIDRILYLDSDIVILSELTSFYNQDFNNKSMIVCAERTNNELINERKKILGFADSYLYFNSGVLLLNLEKLRKVNREEIMECCRNNKDILKYPDQDILNLLYENDIGYAEWKIYNYQLSEKNIKEDIDIRKVKILHFTGPKKPWFFSGIDLKCSKYYWKIKIRMNALNIFKYLFMRSVKEIYCLIKR